MPFVSVQGFRIHYQLSGGGPASLILISMNWAPNWKTGMRSSRTWTRAFACCDTTFGAPASPIRCTAFTMEDQAADLESLVAESNLSPPFLIVGAAAGSAVAVNIAARHPADVSGVILCPPALTVAPDRRRYLTERSVGCA